MTLRLPVTARATAAPLVLALVILAASNALIRTPGFAAAWNLAYLVVGLWCLCTLPITLSILLRNGFVLVPGIIAIASTLWSTAPAETFVWGMRLLITLVIAVRLAAAVSPDQTITVVACVYLAVVGASALNYATGIFAPTHAENGAFLGVFTQKNMYAKSVVIGSIAIVAYGASRGVMALALLLVCAFVPLVVVAKSASSLGALALLFVLVALIWLGRLRPSDRGRVAVIAISAFVGLGAVLAVFWPQIIEHIIALTGKETTLTGRTVLWHYGLSAWSDRPLLGFGHRAFWVSETRTLALFDSLLPDGLLWFHNTAIESLVSVGLIGTTLNAMVLGAIVWRHLHWLVGCGGVAPAFFTTILCLSILGGATDNVLLNHHEVNQILITMGYVLGGYGVRRGSGASTSLSGASTRVMMSPNSSG